MKKKNFEHPYAKEVTLTYIRSGKRQTLIASLGVTFGIAVFIFMNSMMSGFDRNARETVFKATPHIRVYNEDSLSAPLDTNAGQTAVIVNPKITGSSQRIVDPFRIMTMLRSQPGVTTVAPEVTQSVFYINGNTRLTGSAAGISVADEEALFNLSSFIVDGSTAALRSDQNGIIIGTGISKKLNLYCNDYITVTSSRGVTKVMKVVGLYQSGNALADRTKSYVNIAAAQQFLREGSSYITDIYVNIRESTKAESEALRLAKLTGYRTEPWQAANTEAIATAKVRRVMALAISCSIMLVAGFGIYNILNMTVSQKMNEIAIMKAMGFTGKDVVRIFVLQSMIIGIIGVLIGLVMATVLVNVVQHIYVGGSIGYFPIRFETFYFTAGALFGMAVTFFAGYFPARKAARLDPVSIFRK